MYTGRDRVDIWLALRPGRLVLRVRGAASPFAVADMPPASCCAVSSRVVESAPVLGPKEFAAFDVHRAMLPCHPRRTIVRMAAATRNTATITTGACRIVRALQGNAKRGERVQ